MGLILWVEQQKKDSHLLTAERHTWRKLEFQRKKWKFMHPLGRILLLNQW